MSLGDYEEGKKKARAGRWEVRHAFTVCYYYYYHLFFLLEYPAGGSMEKRATVTYNLSDFTIK